MKSYAVYILTNRKQGDFYTGITSDLIQRCEQHASGSADGYTARRGIRHLVWYETHEDVRVALRREKRIKRWTREQKYSAIEEVNPDWRDLARGLHGIDIVRCPKVPE